MKKVKRNKIYYVPGILSLAVLPFLFISYANKEIKEEYRVAIPLVLADINFPKKYPEMFKKFGGAYPPKRNYLDIELTGNEANDKIKLDFARIEISQVLSENDGTKGVHFHFGDSSQYWTFVKAVDILRGTGAKTYMPLDNDLWFYHFPPDTTVVTWVCGTIYSDIVYEKPKLSWWTKAVKCAVVSWKNSWQLVLGFIAFLFAIVILRHKKLHEA